MTLETIEIDPGQSPAGAVIWLHGLGADGHDFEPIVSELDLDIPIRFVFPHAPERAVTVNGGMQMRAWYDIDPGSPLSGTNDIRTSAAAIQELVETENRIGIPTNRIVLAGFSQGGVIALHLGLRAETRFAGLMALSTYVHDHENVGNEVSFVSVDTPIFMAHGIADPMIPITRAVTSREALTALNYQIDWREYGMGHNVCPEEIVDIKGFLERVLS